MKKILVVDDEADICEILQFNLETEGYEVDTASSAEEALEILSQRTYDLVLLDVMMGEISGFRMAQIMKESAKTADISIIFITALDNEDSIVRGLNIGADDYIAKPLNIRETKARVKAVLRRSGKGIQMVDANQFVYETLCLNSNSKNVTIDGEKLSLTKLEFELLSLLLKNPGKVFNREELLEKCWPKDAIVLNRTVDVNITRLRSKIGRYGKLIKTRFGYGYTFEK